VRKTKIIATIGPACQKPNDLKQLILKGVDVIRINTSHTTPGELKFWIQLIRRVCVKIESPVGILVDLQGPRVRTGLLKNHSPIFLKKGSVLTLKVSSRVGTEKAITTACKELPRMVKVGDAILLDNGMIHLKVIQKRKQEVIVRVLAGGKLGENKGVNLPNAPVTLPALTSNDRECLKVATRLKVDFVALSFVRSKKDILTVKKALEKLGSDIPIIAKIEKPKAALNIEDILKVTDMIMVARGDLGIEMGIEKVPIFQKKLIAKANQYGVPAITATQMLESMMEQAHPTRAEVSDIANAIFDGTDAVMLSGETAIGKYPIKAVDVMSRIITETEHHKGLDPDDVFLGASVYEGSPIHAITRAARVASRNLRAKAIVAFTKSWKTAVLVSKLDPRARIIALTPSEETLRRLSILRGVVPVKMKFSYNTDLMLKTADRTVLKQRLLKKGDSVVILSGRQAMPAASQYMINIHRVGEY